MERNRRRYRICFIDYIWYVAETWSAREHNNLNGGMLIFLGWLYAILIPSVLLLGHFLGWLYALLSVALCFLPGLFCTLRYTAGRREFLREHYGKLKHPGRKLVRIILWGMALTVVNFTWVFLVISSA